MKRKNRFIKWTIILLSFMAAVPLMVHLFLASSWGIGLVVDQLEEAYGGRVTLEGIDSGLICTSLHGLRLYDPEHPDRPWLVVHDLTIDVPMWGLLNADEILNNLVVQRAEVDLRFSDTGKLLTRFPQSAGAEGGTFRVKFNRLRFGIHQADRPAFHVDGIGGAVQIESGRLRIWATSQDLPWGAWQAAVSLDLQNDDLLIRLKSACLAVSPNELAKIPFVPEDVWEHVSLDGTVALDLTVSSTPPDDMKYQVVMTPHSTVLDVKSIGLATQLQSGQVIVQDDVVLLQELAGQASAGTLVASGMLDFRSDMDLQLDLQMNRLDVRQLPARWSIPDWLEGNVAGQTNLRIAWAGDSFSITGTGTGAISQARIVDLPADPIKLSLVNDNKLTYLVADGSIKNAKIDRVLQSWNARWPTLPGTLSASAQLRIPLNTLADASTYRLHGSVRVPRIRYQELDLEQLRGDFTFDRGVFKVEELNGLVSDHLDDGMPGSISAKAQFQVAPQGNMSVQSIFKNLPSRPLFAMLGTDKSHPPRWRGDEIRGRLSGDVEATAPMAEPGQVKNWNVSAQITAGSVEITDQPPATFTGNLKLHDGVLTAAKVRGKWGVVHVNAAGHLKLNSAYPFEVQLKVDSQDTNACRQLLHGFNANLDLKGAIQTTASLHGAMEPFQWSAEGTTVIPALSVNRLQFHNTALQWKTDGPALEISSMSASLGGGAVNGTAWIPLRGGTGNAAFRVVDVNVGLLAFGNMDLSNLQGQVSGNLQLVFGFPPGKPADHAPIPLTAMFAVQSPQIRWESIPMQRLRGSGLLRGQAFQYRCTGMVLDGELRVDGLGSLAQSAKPSNSGKLTVTGAQLRRVWGILGNESRLRPLQARIDLDANYQQADLSSTPTAKGRCFVKNLSWDNLDLADSLQADLKWGPKSVQIDRLQGSLCRGRLSGQAGYHFSDHSQSQVDIAWDQADLKRALAPWPALAAHVEGHADIKLRGQLGAETRLTGALAVQRGKLYHINIADLRWPLDISFSPRHRSGRLDIRDGNSQVARGRAVGHATLTWDDNTRLESQLRFFDVDLHELANSGFSRLGKGTVSGRLDLNGVNLSSANHLTGRLDATLKQAQVFDIPVFSQIAPFISIRQSRLPYQTGTMRARLARGVVKVEQLQLTGSLGQLLTEGTVTLPGQLDLTVTASTGLDSQLFRRLGIDLPQNSPIGRGPLTQATNYLSSRLVRLRVKGTVNNPKIRLVPLYFLTEDAARFFSNSLR